MEITMYYTISGHLVGFTSDEAEEEYRADVERGEAEPLIDSTMMITRSRERIEYLREGGMLY